MRTVPPPDFKIPQRHVSLTYPAVAVERSNGDLAVSQAALNHFGLIIRW
jgi:hypothetical protein